MKKANQSIGGLIGAGHPVGASGVRMVLDIYKQVTDQAGEYQIKGAKNGISLKYWRKCDHKYDFCCWFCLMSVEEDLREFYITKTFLQRLKHRASFWEKESIQFQITQFQKKTRCDYPELCEILETVLHTRSLNEFHKKTKNFLPRS